MKRIVAKKKRRKTWKNSSRNANSSSAEKYHARCSLLLFGKWSVVHSHQTLSNDEISSIYVVPVVAMSRGIRVCVPVRLMMHLMKRSHINWSIDRNWMIWSSIGMSASMIEVLWVVSSDISESTFNHNGCLIQSMHDSYYQLTNISQVIIVVEKLAPIDNTPSLLLQVASCPRTSLHLLTRKRVITCHRKDSVNDKQKKMSTKEQQRKRVRQARWNVT